MKPFAKKISRRGFTIVELLVVISIMAVVATLARAPVGSVSGVRSAGDGSIFCATAATYKIGASANMAARVAQAGET